MDEKLFEIAANAMRTPLETAKANYKEIPEIEGCYFWNPIRGGISVIINKNGEKLAATSSVSFEKHLAAFIDGKRN